MSLINQPIPNLFGGVSQQTPLSRYLNQLEEMDNCLADPIEGLRKRPPTEHVARILDSASNVYNSTKHFFKIDRDPDNRFLGVVTDGGHVKVFDITTGEEKTVTGNQQEYLGCTDASTAIRTLTVADYTYIVNREVAVSRAPATAPDRPFEGLIFVKAGNYGKEYAASIVWADDSTPTVASYETQDGSDPIHIDSVKTTTIAEALASGLRAGINPPAIVEVIGSVIYVADPTTNFTIKTEDDPAGRAWCR